MRFDDVNNSSILPLVHVLSRKFGPDNVHGGNCGTFAVAVAGLLADRDTVVTIGILHSGEDNESAREISDNERDIYHVVIEQNGTLYDGTGRLSRAELNAIAHQQYSNPNPGYTGGLIYDSNSVLSAIRNDTNWTISYNKFYLTGKKLIKNVNEASYPGNVGAMEMVKFRRMATPEQWVELKQLIAQNTPDSLSAAWDLIQKVTGVKLHGHS